LEVFQFLIKLVFSQIYVEYQKLILCPSGVYLLRVLQNMKLYTQHNIARESVTVVDTLLLLEDIVGEGYYQFEFRRRLQALRNPDK
jgi:hypothetical protein